MATHDSNPETSDMDGDFEDGIIFFETLDSDFPPKPRKIDPSKILWPDDVPKPWEQQSPPGESAPPK